MVDISEFLIALGRRVRRQRLRQGLTLRALATASGLSERFLSSLEGGRGNISVGRLLELATALRSSPRELLPTPDEEGEGELIALLGLRGAGKTSVGKRLAARLSLPFFELDALVEAECGLTLEQIFEFHGEDFYRRLEYQVLDSLFQKASTAVIATGGGIVTAPEAYALLLRRATTIWLQATPEDHWRRVLAQGDGRPMADNPQAMAQLRTILDQRQPLYARAQYKLDTHGKSVDSLVESALALLEASLLELPQAAPKESAS